MAKVEKSLMARNQEFGLSTVHSRSQSLKVVALKNVHMGALCDQSDGVVKEV